MDSLLLQKQVCDNANDLQGFLLDLKNWQADMKRKDAELQDTSPDNQLLPPRRNKMKRVKKDKKTEVVNAKTSEKKNRIPSNDYSSWDKFDVNKACEEIDLQKANEDSDDSSEQVEFDDSQKVLREEAVYEKEMGNEYVKKQKWKDAMICYNRAIECYPYDAIFYANRALCYLKTSNLKSAEADCTSSLQLDASYVKAYQRRAAARIGMGQLKEARSDLLKVLELEPQNSASRTELSKLEQKMNPKEKQVTKQKKPLSASSPKGIPQDKDDKCLVKKVDVEKEQDGSGDSALIQESWSTGMTEMLRLVKTIHKPPHLRSKKPLKRILIQEVDAVENRRNYDCDKIEHSGGNTDITVPTKCDEEPQGNVAKLRDKFCSETQNKPGSNSTECQPKIEPSTSSAKMEKICLNTLTLHTSIEEQIPSVPKSSVQFLTGWKNVKSNSRLRSLYLKQIPGNELPHIFQDSLESDIFSDLLSVLKTDFLPSREAVYPYLLGLSNVRRFAALTMFLTKADKTGIKELLDHCEKSGECSQEEVLLLAKRYEIK